MKIAMVREEGTHTLTLETPLLRKVEDTPFDRGTKKEGSKKKSKYADVPGQCELFLIQ